TAKEQGLCWSNDGKSVFTIEDGSLYGFEVATSQLHPHRFKTPARRLVVKADDTFDVVLEDGSLVRWNNQGNALVPAGYGAKPVVAKLVMATHRSGLVATAANGGVIKVSFNGPTQRSEVDLQGHTSAVVG